MTDDLSVFDDCNHISTAAAILGRKGGSAKSPRKTASSRENGKKGGRPRRDAEYVNWKREYEKKHPVCQASTGQWGYARVNDGIDLSACKYDTERAAKLARNQGLYEYYLYEKKQIEEARNEGGAK